VRAAGRGGAARAVVTEAGARAVEMAAAAKVVVRAVVETVAAMVEVVREVVTGKFRARKQRRCTRPPSLTHARRGRAWLARPFGHTAKVARDRLEHVQSCGAARLQNGDHSFPALTRYQEPRAGRYQWCCQGAYTGQTHTKQAQTDQAHTG